MINIQVYIANSFYLFSATDW